MIFPGPVLCCHWLTHLQVTHQQTCMILLLHSRMFGWFYILQLCFEAEAAISKLENNKI